jgi:hypothetical protein
MNSKRAKALIKFLRLVDGHFCPGSDLLRRKLRVMTFFSCSFFNSTSVYWKQILIVSKVTGSYSHDIQRALMSPPDKAYGTGSLEWHFFRGRLSLDLRKGRDNMINTLCWYGTLKFHANQGFYFSICYMFLIHTFCCQNPVSPSPAYGHLLLFFRWCVSASSSFCVTITISCLSQ